MSDWQKAYRKPVEVQVRPAREGESWGFSFGRVQVAREGDWVVRLPNAIPVLLTAEEFEQVYVHEDQVQDYREALRWIRQALEIETPRDEIIERVNRALA